MHARDGRVLALMPHPERVTKLESNSWYPSPFGALWKGQGPWIRIFQSASKWCECTSADYDIDWQPDIARFEWLYREYISFVPTKKHKKS
jgi:hypothetical protein